MNKSSDNLPQISNRAKTACTNVRNYFKQYCESTSIHGFRYFGENRSNFERLWWLIIYIIILTCCSFMIYKIYEKYDASPVVVTFSTKETPVYKIPFPTVTICPETKSLKTKFDYTEMIRKKLENLSLTPTENKYFQYMTSLCDDHDDISDDDFESLLKSELTNSTFNASDFLNTIDELKPVLDNNDSLIISCSLFTSTTDCMDLIVPVITDEGVCYSINILDRTEIFSDIVSHYKEYHDIDDNKGEQWGIEAGYGRESAYPVRAYLAGASNGLTLRMATLNRDLDYVCKQIQGFKVVLHAPFRMPRLKHEYFRVPLDQAVIAAVQPVMITTSEKVKSFDVRKRECYFSTEKKLKYFRFYSQQNCRLECLTTITLNECGCVKIFMPREESTEICGPEKQNCTKEAAESALTAELYSSFDDNVFRDDDEYHDYHDTVNCGCLPLCTDITYRSETSQSNWDWEEPYRLMNKKNYTKEQVHLSSLTIYFKTNHFITSERQELYGPTDFVANFGGLLGLFTGFSMLSLMEIIYFLTVRICCNIRLYGRWTGAEE